MSGQEVQKIIITPADDDEDEDDAILKTIAEQHGLGLEKVREYKSAFDVFDKDKSGSITADELGNIWRTLGQNPTEAEIEAMVNEADEDNNGSIDFGEFCGLMMKHEKGDEDGEQSLRDAFKMFDKDGNGFIDPYELKFVLSKIGEPMSDIEIDQMIKEADRNGDGVIDYEEFVTLMNDTN